MFTASVAKCASDLESGVPDATETGGQGTVTMSGSTMTITWLPPYDGSTASAQATTVATITLTPPNPDETETKVCPTSTTEMNLSGAITADTTDPAGTDTDVGGTIVAEVCVNSRGGQKLEPGTILKFLDPSGG